MVTKGKQGDYSDVWWWFTLMTENVDILCELLMRESKNQPESQVPSILKMIKLGLLSEDYHSTEISMKLFLDTLHLLSKCYL